ncbi:MAG TPA: glycosyltransferase [Anaerolineales bacterium]|nr:glycosyltransferase [Anaerolineales bacterium]
MRIFQVIDTLTTGGAQALLLTFAKEMQARGQALTVICLDGARSSPVEEQLQELGAHLVYVPGSRLFDLPRLLRLYRVLRSERADGVHTHLTYANILGSLAGWLAGLTVVATIHSEAPDPGWDNQARHLVETWALRRFARRVIAVGPRVEAGQRRRMGAGKVVAVPNAVTIPPVLSAAKRAAMRRELQGDGTGPVLIAVGRLSPEKGYLDLLEAFASLLPRLPAARLLIAGDGALRETLQAKIQSLGLAGRVSLLGWRSDVPRLLSACDLFVSASHWEGLPIAVLEAMACALPVVATAVGDLPEVISPETGALVPPGQPQELARALETVLVDPERLTRMGQAAREQVQCNYHSRVWADRLLEVYRQAREVRRAGLFTEEARR